MTPAMASRASALDRLDLALLRLAKHKRSRIEELSSYDEFFAEHDVLEYLEDVRNVWRFSVVRRELARLFPSGVARVLDVGCGLGVALDHLPPSVAYVGLDPSAKTLERASRMHPDARDRFARGAFPRLPVESGAWDLVLCLEVLEHLPDDADALAELERVVKPGGYLLLSVPSTYYWPAYRDLIGHYRHYSATALADVLASHGFQVNRRLPQFRALWRGYYYVYAILRLFELLVRKAGARTYSLYHSAPYRAVSSWLLRRLERRGADADLSSTFVLCRRVTVTG